MLHSANIRATFPHIFLSTPLVTVYGKHHILNYLIPECKSYHGKTEVKKTLSTTTFLMSCASRPLFPLQQLPFIFPSLSLAVAVSVETRMVSPHIPPQIQVQMGFSFHNPFPACWDSVSVLLLGHLSLLASSVFFIFMFQISQEQLDHPCRPPITFV